MSPELKMQIAAASIAMDAARRRKSPRYTTYFRKTVASLSQHTMASWSRPGYDYEITDEDSGLVVRSGWCAGPKRDALAAAKQAIRELEGNP